MNEQERKGFLREINQHMRHNNIFSFIFPHKKLSIFCIGKKIHNEGYDLTIKTSRKNIKYNNIHIGDIEDEIIEDFF